MEVTLTMADEVQELRRRLSDAEGDMLSLHDSLRQSQAAYGMQVDYNTRLNAEIEELWDYLEERGLKSRPPNRRKRK